MHDFEIDPGAARAAPRRPSPGPEGSGPLASGGAVAGLLHLQRTVGNAGVVQMLADETEAERSPVHDVVGRGGGASLDPGIRQAMEARFGTDFGDVRVHSDSTASRSAEAVGANAYTVGSDIVFRSGHFDPGSPTGQRTLAHELAHVVQQRSGPVDGSEAPGGIRLSDPGDRFERAADRTAEAVVAGGAPAPVPAGTMPSVQAEHEDEELPIQRETEAPAEDELEEA